MIVLDASAAVDLLLDTPKRGRRVADQLLAHDGDVHAPHLLDAEVGQVLRRFVLSRQIPRRRAHLAVERLRELTVTRYPHLPLLPRAMELLPNFTVDDGLYVALAEALEASLVTGDGPLARAAGRLISVVETG